MAAKAWYQFPRIDNFGQKDPQGNYWKPDSNILTPSGYPVTALLPGTVTSAVRTSFGQMTITIRLDHPLNHLATHTFYEHMHDATVSRGSHVGGGRLIGHANHTGEGAALGFGLYSGDVYGSGSAWNVLQNDLKPHGAGLLNPVSLLDAAASGHLGGISSGSGGNSSSDSGGSTSSGPGPISALKTAVDPAQLAPTVEVTTFLWALDQSLALTNPFDVPNVQQDTIAGLTFTDPIAWISQVTVNLVDDMSAMLIRFILILLGIFVLYKVASTWIDFGAAAQSAIGAGQTIAKGAALLAA